MYCLKKESHVDVLKSKRQCLSDGSEVEWYSCRRELRSQTSFSCSFCRYALCYMEQKFHIHSSESCLSLPALHWALGQPDQKAKAHWKTGNYRICRILFSILLPLVLYSKQQGLLYSAELKVSSVVLTITKLIQLHICNIFKHWF